MPKRISASFGDVRGSVLNRGETIRTEAKPLGRVRDRCLSRLRLTLNGRQKVSKHSSRRADRCFVRDYEEGKKEIKIVGRVPGHYWLNSVVVRLNDDMVNLGDVLLRISVRGVLSNRVRLGIGHNSGSLLDDPGTIPTPGREP